MRPLAELIAAGFEHYRSNPECPAVGEIDCRQLGAFIAQYVDDYRSVERAAR